MKVLSEAHVNAVSGGFVVGGVPVNGPLSTVAFGILNIAMLPFQLVDGVLGGLTGFGRF